MTLSGEVQESFGALAEKVGIKTIQENGKKKPFTTKSSLNLTLGDEPTIGLDSTLDYSYSDQVLSGNLDISAFNLDFLEFMVAAKNNMLYFSAPKLLQDSFCFNTETLGKDYQQSALHDMIGVNVSEELSFEIFPPETGDSKVDTTKLSRMEQHTEAILQKTKVSYMDEPKADKGIVLTLPKDETNAMLRDLYQELSKEKVGAYLREIQFLNDIELLFDLDKNNNILAIYTERSMEVDLNEGLKIDLLLCFNGENRKTDVIEGKLVFTSGGASQNLKFVLKQESDIKDLKQKIDLLINTQDEEIQILYEGQYQDVKKGEAFTWNIENLALFRDGNRDARINGTLTVEPCQREITVLEEAKEILKMSREELEQLVKEVLFLGGIKWIF